MWLRGDVNGNARTGVASRGRMSIKPFLHLQRVYRCDMVTQQQITCDKAPLILREKANRNNDFRILLEMTSAMIHTTS